MPEYVAFFRNVNLGQGNNPTRPQLESAFAGAGAQAARSFLSNGTVVFAVDAGQAVAEVVERACQALEAACGLREPAYVRRLHDLAGLVAADPFAGIDVADPHEYSMSFLPPGAGASLTAPLWSARRDLAIVRVTGDDALGVRCQVDGRAGSATAFLEQLLQVPVTTRNWNTVLRLVKRFA